MWAFFIPIRKVQIMNDTTKEIYQSLKATYNKSAIDKRELASELGCSVSIINYYLAKGINLPNYKKFTGNGNGGKVLFPLQEVAIFLTQTTKVA